MTQALQNQIDRLYRRILMNVAPAKILATDDSGPIHRVQVNLNGGPEIIDQVPLMQHYGLNAHAPIGSDAAAMFIAGQRSNAVIVGTNNQAARLRNLQPGEVALYTDEGDNLKFGRSQAVSLTAGNSFSATTKAATIKGTDSVTLDAPTTTVTQNLKAQGQVDASGGFFVNGVPIGSGGGGGGEPGPPGPAGPAGEAATIAVGTTVTGAAGTPANVVNVGTPSAAVFDFTIPQGIQGVAGATGATGSPGAAASIQVGTTTTGAPGTQASVTNTGSSAAAVFNFTIPAGVAGAQGTPGTPGAAGAAATIAVGTTITGAPGTAAAVVNVGTPAAAVFNFTIPAGQTGATGATGPQGPPGSAGSAAGANLSIQYNNAGAFAGDIWSISAHDLIGNFSGSPAPTSAIASLLQIVGAAGSQVGIQIDGFAGNAVAAFRRADGTPAAPAALAITETLGQLNFTGYNGSAYGGNVALMRGVTTQAWTPTATGAGLAWGTTPNGAIANVVTMGLGMGGLGGLTLPMALTDMGQGTVNASAGYYLNGANLIGDWTFAPGQIVGNNATSNWIQWNTAGIAAPTFTTRSTGTKLVLYPSLSASSTDYALGIQSGGMWFSGANYYWYATNATQIMSLTGAGALTLAGGMSLAGLVQTSGSNSALFCYSRDSGTLNWGLYAQGGVARIWNSTTGDLVTIGSTGNVGLLAGASLTIGNLLTSAASGGVFTISGTPTVTGMLSTPGGITSTANIICSQSINPAANNASSVGSSTVAWNQMNSYNWFTASDRREKTGIEALPLSLGLVLDIEPKRFRWAEGDDERTHWGFVAQEVGEAMAAAGHDFGGHNAEGERERLGYNELIAVLWQATRELAARVAHLEAAA